MKQIKTLLGALCLLLLAVAGCEDELPQSAQIEKGKESIAFDTGTGSRTVKIEASHAWTAVSSQTWLTVSPAKGAAGHSELTLTAAANTTNLSRTATVTIKVGHKQSTIQVTQAQKEAMELDKTSETVAWMAGTCLLTVSANVDDYTVESDATWLRESPLRAMTDYSVLLSYDENPTYEPRTAKVTVSGAGLSSLFTVTQGGRGALYFVLERAEVAAAETQYALKLMKNTDTNSLELIDEADWLSLPGNETKAMPVEETVMLTLLPNMATTPREARLVINNQSTGTLLTDTFTLVQQALAHLLSPGQTTYAVEAAGQTISLPVEASGAFDVLIATEAATWLTGSGGVQLPGTLEFEVAENTQAEPRTATITLSLQENPATQATVTITQAAAEVPAIDKLRKLYNLPDIATVIETEPVELGAFRATVSYDPGDATNWLSDINTNNGKLHFVVSDNSATGAKKRSATLHLVPERGEAVDIRVNQSGHGEAYIELAKPGTLASFVDLSQPAQYENIRLVAAQGINADDFNTLRSTRLGVKRANLKEVKNLTVLPAGAFRECSTLQEVWLPAGLTAIGSEAFAGCRALTAMPLNATLRQIGDRAFAHAFSGSTLTTLDLSTAVALTTLGEGAFEGCNTLFKLTLAPSLTTIGSGAFKECYSLTDELKLPATLAAIGNEAFYNCNKLTGTLGLPATLTTLGARAFMKCASLSELTVAATGLTTIGEEAFKECSALGATATAPMLIPTGIVRIGRSAFENTGVKAVDLPATLAEIGQRAFHNCNALTEVTCRKAGTPPALDTMSPEETFGKIVGASRQLMVPATAVEAYTNDEAWKKATDGWTITVWNPTY